MSAKDERIELLEGTVDLLVHRTRLLGAAHGHAIAKGIARGADDVLQVEQGASYPARQRPIKRGWITFDGGVPENNRPAKLHRLTPKFQRQLDIETNGWERVVRGTAHVLRPA